MTWLPELSYTWDTPTVHTGRVTVTGNIVCENAKDLLRVITDELAADPGVRELHVDCSGLDVCDSTGLSVLLMLRRRADSLGIDLHVVNRPSTLDRMLERTGTREYLTGCGQGEQREDQEPSG
jgi:anti-anti-sigma factor